MLDRETGAILKMSGQVSSIRTSKSTSSPLAAQPATAKASFPGDAAAGVTGIEHEGSEELAAMVWRFIGTADGLVDELDTEVRPSGAFHSGLQAIWARLTVRRTPG